MVRHKHPGKVRIANCTALDSKKSILELHRKPYCPWEENLLWNQDSRHFTGWKISIILWNPGCTHTSFLFGPEEK